MRGNRVDHEKEKENLKGKVSVIKRSKHVTSQPKKGRPPGVGVGRWGAESAVDYPALLGS